MRRSTIIIASLLLHGCGCSGRSLEGEADVGEIFDPPGEVHADPVVDTMPDEEIVWCEPCDGETCDNWTTCLEGGPVPHMHLEPVDTALHMFGVHWADEDITVTGTIVLEISCTQVPVILSLSGCHSIHWVIEADPEVVIEHVFTSGWEGEEQIVTGVEGVPVERVADTCGHISGGADARAIEAEIESRTGVRATTFTGVYYATGFSLSHWCP